MPLTPLQKKRQWILLKPSVKCEDTFSVLPLKREIFHYRNFTKALKCRVDICQVYFTSLLKLLPLSSLSLSNSYKHNIKYAKRVFLGHGRGRQKYFKKLRHRLLHWDRWNLKLSRLYRHKQKPSSSWMMTLLPAMKFDSSSDTPWNTMKSNQRLDASEMLSRQRTARQ